MMIAALALLATAAPVPPADAAPVVVELPRDRLILSNALTGRVNPIGLDLQNHLTWQSRIGDSDELLWKPRYWNVSATAGVSPANWTAGVAAEVEPIAVFKLRAAYEARGYFGTFGTLISGADSSLPITDAALDADDKRGKSQAALEQSLSIQPTLQFQIGPVAAQNIFQASYGVFDVRAGDVAVYDPGNAMLVPQNGVTLSDTTVVAYLDGPFTGGVLYQYLDPLGLDGDDVHRVGGFASYDFYDRGTQQGFCNKANLTLAALFNVHQRDRASAIPTLVAVVSIDSDLL